MGDNYFATRERVLRDMGLSEAEIRERMAEIRKNQEVGQWIKEHPEEFRRSGVPARFR
jgi:hypothetical protein